MTHQLLDIVFIVVSLVAILFFVVDFICYKIKKKSPLREKYIFPKHFVLYNILLIFTKNYTIWTF